MDLSYEFIKQNNPNRLEWQLKKDKKLSKKLIAENKGAGVIEVLRGADLAEEVKLAADKIIEIKNKNKVLNWNDFAVLVRANDSANDFMAEFDRRGLPYIFGASRGLYAKPLIMDAIAYFKLLDNYHESLALWRILKLPIFNFTDEELINFNHVANKKAWSLYEVLSSGRVLKFSAGLEKKIQPVLSLIAKHSAEAREKPVSVVFLAFMNDSGYLKYLTREENQKNLEAINLLNQFLSRIKAFENSSDDKSVKAFLSELNLEREAGEEGGLAPDLEAGPEAIKILTAHGAKGLEFKYVFIANLVDKRFPTIEHRDQIELPDALVKEILPEGDAHLEEERRLFYVAMTRAKTGLYFSWAADYGGARDKKPSRFLIELGLVKNSITPLTPLSKGGGEGLKLPAAKDSRLRGDDKPAVIPSHFSYSQLAAYSACPYQYRFAHILKIPTRGKEVFSFGKTLHSTLQKLFTLLNEKKGLGQTGLFDGVTTPTPPLQGGQKNPPSKGGFPPVPNGTFGRERGLITFEEILKLYEESWVDDWFESKDKKIKRKQQGREILKAFYEKYKDNWPTALFLEKGFNYRIVDNKDAYVVRGVVDRIDKSGGGLKLVDYKTGKPKDKLTFEAKEQLLIYQLAIRELFKEDVKTLAFYYLDNNSEVEFIGSDKDLEKIRAKIINTINEIKQGRFGAKPGALCDWCDFKEICEYRG